MLIILIVSLEKFNNPIFAFNAYKYYDTQLNIGFSQVVDIASFKDYTMATLTRILFKEASVVD